MDKVAETLGVNYWLDQKDGHDAHVYANDYVLSPAEIVERLNEATAGWTQKGQEIAALREKLSSSNECLDMVRETLAAIDGADSPCTPPMMYPEWIQGVVRRQTEKLREEITRMYDLKQKFIAEIGRLNALVAKLDAKNAELWAAVALAIGETDGKEDA